MYISKKDFNLIYSAYFTMTEVLADFDDIMTDEEDEDGNVTEVYYITEDGQLEYIPYDEEKLFTFSVYLPESDYNILDKYGFYFQKNIADYLHNVAMEVIQAEKNC